VQSNFNNKTYFFAGDGFFGTGLLVPELELGLLFVGLLFGGEGNFLDPGEDLAELVLLDVGLTGLLLSAPVAPIFFSFPQDDEGDTLNNYNYLLQTHTGQGIFYSRSFSRRRRRKGRGRRMLQYICNLLLHFVACAD
jgi:hypothetical protein